MISDDSIQRKSGTGLRFPFKEHQNDMRFGYKEAVK